ncbi:unnamed protein product, partial [Adineta steineri]
AAVVPLLDENYVCDSIVDGIRRNKRMIILPPHNVLFYMLKGLLSDECADRFIEFTGAAKAMDTFVGQK